MYRLDEKQKKILIGAGIVLLIAILIGAGLLVFPSLNQEAPPPVYREPQQVPTIGDPNDPDFKSPYVPTENYTGTMVTVWNDTLRLVDTTIKTTTNPNADFVQYADIEDLITITLPRQNLGIQTSKIKLIIVTQEDMKDPYLTSVSELNALTIAEFTEKDDGTLQTTISLNYSQPIKTFINVFFIYDNNIESFTMLRIDKKQLNSKQYFEYLKPGSTVHEIVFQMGDTLQTYYYYAGEVNTLHDWIQSTTNPHKWQANGKLIMNSDATWYLTAEQTAQTLHDGDAFVLTEITDTHTPIAPHQFDITNEQYMAYYLHKSASIIKAHFGTPTHTVTFSNITKIEYDNYIFYVENEKGVVQIDVKPGIRPVLDTIPYQTTTAEKIKQLCRYNNISYSNLKDKSQPDLKFYVKYISLQTSNGYVSYVWENELQINPDFTEFTRIVIHSDEEYIY